MAERFMGIDDLEGKSMTIMMMSAYAEGKAAANGRPFLFILFKLLPLSL